MEFDNPVPPPITHHLPGVRGVIKKSPEDFVVEEVPAYHPSGEGEHLFLWIQKRDVSAEELVRRISRAAGVSRNDIGVAGLKDRFAVTRQYVSVPARCEESLADFADEQVEILSRKRHTNKLRTGHLQGNRFEIVVHNVPASDQPNVAAIAQRLGECGLPNYYGAQRFGRNNETVALGFDLLAGRKSSRDIARNRRRFLLRLSLSAAQSFLFNEYVRRRIAGDHWGKVLAGDCMQVIASGGKFIVEDAAAEQLRHDAGETAITGPLFGPKMKNPEHLPAGMESELLSDYDFSSTMFDQFPKLTRGSRRPVALHNLALHWEFADDSIRFQFFLPAGSYATVLLREFIREKMLDFD